MASLSWSKSNVCSEVAAAAAAVRAARPKKVADRDGIVFSYAQKKQGRKVKLQNDQGDVLVMPFGDLLVGLLWI